MAIEVGGLGILRMSGGRHVTLLNGDAKYMCSVLPDCLSCRLGSIEVVYGLVVMWIGMVGDWGAEIRLM